MVNQTPQGIIGLHRQFLRLLTAGGLFVFTLMPGANADERSFDEIVQSIVTVHAEIPANARTAQSLGMERLGNGIVIDDQGLILTIGYIILEASKVQVNDANSHAVPADIVAYDHNTGFGLIKAKRALGIEPVEIGISANLEVGGRALVISRGGPRSATPVKLVSRRDFAGYWEYLLEGALFTVPPHPHFGGAALLNGEGKLIGVGSLIVNDAFPADVPLPGNMFVPIDALKPILPELLANGRSNAPARPWLGIYPAERGGRVIVTRVAAGGPAQQAGIKAGDIVMGVKGRRVANVADFYRKLWAVGPAGSDVSVDVLSPETGNLEIQSVSVKSRDRYDWLKLGPP